MENLDILSMAQAAALLFPARAVLRERRHQATAACWSPGRDNLYEGRERGIAAARHARRGDMADDDDAEAPSDWRWDDKRWNLAEEHYNVVKASTLILAGMALLGRLATLPAASLNGGER